MFQGGTKLRLEKSRRRKLSILVIAIVIAIILLAVLPTGCETTESTTRVRLLDSKGEEIAVSIELGNALAELAFEAEVKAEAGDDFSPVIGKMLQLLEANGFEAERLEAVVNYEQAGAGVKIKDIILYYN